MNPQNESLAVSVQTSEPDDNASRLTRHGITIVKRHGRQDEKYTCRIRFKKKVHHLTLAETAKKSFDIAVAARRAIHEGRWTALKDQTALRHVRQLSLGEVFVVYRQFLGPDRPAESTIELNIHALKAIVREVLGEVEVSALPVATMTAELIWKWKEGKRKLAGEAHSDERSLQILRSANSRLRQARSIFSDNEELRTFYRHHKLNLPDSLAAFCNEPPFGDCSKDEYHAPSDAIVAKTFEALEKLGKSTNSDDVNMFKACWLAIGFGLRKSEISSARNNWFKNVDGTIICRGDVLAKNKKFPEVRAQLDAWARIGPLVEDKEAQEYVLVGSKTERTDICFRRLSDWMRSLGWETTHHVHEFRAWAGCQIAMAPNNSIREAQAFMRHASFATTEKFYGHHLKIKLTEVKLAIPQVKPKEFKPVVLPEASAQTA